jgi:transposase InsO family protein
MVSIAQVKEFIKVSKGIEFTGAKRKEKYAWIEEVLLRFRYFTLRKKEKSVLKRYLIQMTGFSDAQITRLIAKKKKTGKILPDTTRRNRFPKRYTSEDVARIIETDNAHNRLSGPATKKIFERMYDIFKDSGFLRLKEISVSHLYNLRDTRQYRSFVRFFVKTKPTPVNIGERRKPNPQGKPGFLRIDTVHQGDRDKEKGVYHINIVDEVTQWEIVGCVEGISEHFLMPLLESLLAQFPFVIRGFHSDNGGEYINKVVARLLNKLLIDQTKSRSRHTNDNALVEGKNGSIVRKHMGYMHIPRGYAAAINRFYKEHFNVYLNFHRPCGFAEERISEQGKVKKVYNLYLTPFEALRSHCRTSDFLKKGVSMENLEEIANAMSDNECATRMQKAKDELFKSFTRQKLQFPTTRQHHFGFIS